MGSSWRGRIARAQSRDIRIDTKSESLKMADSKQSALRGLVED